MNKLIKYLFYALLVWPVVSTTYAKDTILIATKKGHDFQTLSTYLTEDLSNKYIVKSLIVNKNYSTFKSSIETIKPKLLILMDNSAVSFAEKYYLETNSKIQSVAVMGLNYKKVLARIKNICGVSYEVPPFTMLTQARYSISNKTLKNILVFYRGSLFADFVETARKRLLSENIELSAIDVEKSGDDPIEYLTTKGYLEFSNNEKYDAVLILLDSALLNKKTFQSFWQKGSIQSDLPFIVGTEKLVLPQMDLAVFGMSPNLQDLSDQTVQIVESILEENSTCAEIGVEDLIGVNKIWNQKKANSKEFELNDNAKSDLKILGKNN